MGCSSVMPSVVQSRDTANEIIHQFDRLIEIEYPKERQVRPRRLHSDDGQQAIVSMMCCCVINTLFARVLFTMNYLHASEAGTKKGQNQCQVLVSIRGCISRWPLAMSDLQPFFWTLAWSLFASDSSAVFCWEATNHTTVGRAA